MTIEEIKRRTNYARLAMLVTVGYLLRRRGVLYSVEVANMLVRNGFERHRNTATVCARKFLDALERDGVLASVRVPWNNGGLHRRWFFAKEEADEVQVDDERP